MIRSRPIKLVKLQGNEVWVAHGGMAALEIAKDYIREVVFLDIEMPVMDRYEVAHRLRKENRLENAAVAAITGWGRKTIAARRSPPHD